MKSAPLTPELSPIPKILDNSGAIVLLAAIAALYFTRDILIPFAFALVLTFLLTPMVTMFQKLRIGRAFSVVCTVSVSLSIAGAIGWIIGNQLIEVANQLPSYRQNIHRKIDAMHKPVTGQLGQAAQSVKEVVNEVTSPAPPVATGTARQKQASSPAPIPVRMVVPATSELTDLVGLGTPVLAPLGQAAIVILFTAFMLLKREDLRNRLLRLAGLSQLNIMTQALDDAARRVSRYILLQFLVNGAFGVLFGLGLYWIGVPNPVLWGALAAILRIIPYVGTMVAATMPIALSLAVFEGWLNPFLIFAMVMGFELIIGNIVEPWLYGAQVGISSLALLVTSVFWTVLWGPAGLILSTPLTVCVVVLGRYVPQLSFLHILLGDEPVLADEAKVYQRLLAMDHQETRAIVDQFLKGRPLVELYDSVLIPALGMAEQDRHKGAIDSASEEFLFLTINEMIVEFSEYQHEVSEPVGDPVDAGDFRVLCIPAGDKADEITAAMLAQLLGQQGLAAITFSSTGAAPMEWMPQLETGRGDLVCISALPPYAFAPARALCKQIRERFPKLKVIVCVWGFSGDTEKAMSRFERTKPDRLSTSLAGALTHVQELLHPVTVVPPFS